MKSLFRVIFAFAFLTLTASFSAGFAQNLSASNRIGAAKTDDENAGIYIPPDQRHKGLSKFDQLPFTDRKKGDPERYRALNPKFVKKENGNYYFLLKAKSNAHYFDENLDDKGVISDQNVAVDLTNVKKAKGSDADEKAEKYYYAKNLGYIPATSLEQSFETIKGGYWLRFPLKKGEHTLYDGTGIPRGIITENKVRLNYGQQKQINGESYYYVFSSKIALPNSKDQTGASGWMKASAIEEGNDPQYSAETVEKMQPPATPNATFTKYEITGGDQQEIIGKDDKGNPIYKYGFLRNGEFVSYKVLPRTTDANVAATDYLKRSDDVVNLGFNVAGVSNDTFRINGANRPLIFYRSSDKDATANIDLYFPKDATHDGEQSIGKMIFVYGYVDVAGSKRWGWIPLDALKPKT